MEFAQGDSPSEPNGAVVISFRFQSSNQNHRLFRKSRTQCKRLLTEPFADTRDEEIRYRIASPSIAALLLSGWTWIANVCHQV